MISKRTVLILFPLLTVLMVTSCNPKYPACEQDSHCREGEFCVNGQCQECRDDGDCPEDMKCARGVCRNPGYCEETSDCAEGQVCRDNRCSPCFDTSECPSGKACIDGSCKEPECSTDEQCPAGLYCKEGACKPQETASATGDLGDCDIESIYFDFDAAEVKPAMRKKLERTYECLTKNTGLVVLEGHCDPRGTTEYNMGLGDRRARIAKKLLKVMGIDSSKLRVVSKGEEEASGYNEESWAKDRRVDFE
jgi:peptidoglycan-associated lipoprotein